MKRKKQSKLCKGLRARRNLDVRVDPEQGDSNTGHAPEVDDEDPKQVEYHGDQDLRRLTQGEWSQVLNWRSGHVEFQLAPMRRKDL